MIKSKGQNAASSNDASLPPPPTLFYTEPVLPFIHLMNTTREPGLLQRNQPAHTRTHIMMNRFFLLHPKDTTQEPGLLQRNQPARARTHKR